jgi:hypothetical protein
MRLGKNLRTKKRSFGQFLINILIQDFDPDSNPDQNPKLTSGRIRIRNFCFGFATLGWIEEEKMGKKSGDTVPSRY